MTISLTEEELYFLIEWAKFGVFDTHEDHRSRVVEKWGNIVNRLYKEGIKIYGWQFDDEGKDSFNILFAKDGKRITPGVYYCHECGHIEKAE